MIHQAIVPQVQFQVAIVLGRYVEKQQRLPCVRPTELDVAQPPDSDHSLRRLGLRRLGAIHEVHICYWRVAHGVACV
eukprot:960004-Lingulodinium_polyedra.AAC.2